MVHDPTQLNRQGPDHGTQYRSAIFTTNADQEKRGRRPTSRSSTRRKLLKAPIVTKVTTLDAFYPAEDYHQDYASMHPNNPYIVINDAPKVVHLQQQFADLYQSEPVLTRAQGGAS